MESGAEGGSLGKQGEGRRGDAGGGGGERDARVRLLVASRLNLLSAGG